MAQLRIREWNPQYVTTEVGIVGGHWQTKRLLCKLLSEQDHPARVKEGDDGDYR